MSSDSFQPVQPDPSGRPVAPAGSPFAQPPVPTPGSFAPPVPELEPVRTTAPRSRRGGGGMLLNALLGLALVVAVGGVAFAWGRATAPAAAAANRTATNGQGGQFFGPRASGAPDRGGFGGGALSVQGTVEAIDGTSIRIKTAGGATVTLGLNGATTYNKQAPATSADVTTGSTVIVQVEGRGRGNGQGGPAASGAPSASGAPATGFGSAGSVTVVP